MINVRFQQEVITTDNCSHGVSHRQIFVSLSLTMWFPPNSVFSGSKVEGRTLDTALYKILNAIGEICEKEARKYFIYQRTQHIIFTVRNPLLPHGLLFFINSKGFFICTTPVRTVTPVMEHWLEREIAQWVHCMNNRSDDPSHHERMLLPQSYISVQICKDLLS